MWPTFKKGSALQCCKELFLCFTSFIHLFHTVMQLSLQQDMMNWFVHCDLNEVGQSCKAICLVADRLLCFSSVLLSSNMRITILINIMLFNQFWRLSFNSNSSLSCIRISKRQMHCFQPHSLMLHLTFSITSSCIAVLIDKAKIETSLLIDNVMWEADHHWSLYCTQLCHSF